LADSSGCPVLVAFLFCPIWAEITHTGSDLQSRPEAHDHGVCGNDCPPSPEMIVMLISFVFAKFWQKLPDGKRYK
jgi:hypothetical protein